MLVPRQVGLAGIREPIPTYGMFNGEIMINYWIQGTPFSNKPTKAIPKQRNLGPVVVALLW